MRGLALSLCLIGQQVGAATCFTFGDTGLMLTVDGAFTMEERDGGAVLTLAPQARSPFTISLGPPDALDTPKSLVLENGMTFVYGTATEEAVGSGGAAAFLEGVLGSVSPLGVTCAMQGEVPDAEWCLPVLGRLRTEAEGCETGGE
jgi:hypothetical protein